MAIDFLGDLAPYATVSPQTVELLPAAEHTATILLQVPADNRVRAGDHVVGVRAQSQEDAWGSAVEELLIQVRPFGALTISVVPHTLTSGQSAQISISNLGNSPSTLSLSFEDPEAALVLRPTVNALQVAPGQTATINLHVKARRRPPRGQTRTFPFRVVARGQEATATTDATVSLARSSVPVAKLLGGLASMAIVAVAVASGLFFYRQNRDKISVSDVRQLPFSQAAVALQGNGLQVGQKLEVVTGDAQGGVVLDQDPKQNARVPKGSRVILTVGYSTPKASIPSVSGRPVAAATDVLTKAGFFNVRTQSKQSDKAAGIVIEQVPLPGGPAAALTQDITLVVSAGPSAVAVPAVAGTTEAAARKALQAAGFMAISTKRSGDAAVPKDKVIGTEPAGQAAPTSPITIIVSDGPSVQSVPQLVGQTLAAAQQALLDQGLALGTTVSKTGPPGQVLEQDPPPGKSVSPGSAVNLTVGQAAGAAPTASLIDPRLMPSARVSPSTGAAATTR